MSGITLKATVTTAPHRENGVSVFQIQEGSREPRWVYLSEKPPFKLDHGTRIIVSGETGENRNIQADFVALLA